MFSWNVLCSTALISTCTPLFLVKSAASAWNCLANVVPLSLVPQVTVPVGEPPPAELDPPEEVDPPPQADRKLDAADRGGRADGPLEERAPVQAQGRHATAGTRRARYSDSDSGRDMATPRERGRTPTRDFGVPAC